MVRLIYTYTEILSESRFYVTAFVPLIIIIKHWDVLRDIDILTPAFLEYTLQAPLLSYQLNF